MSLTAWFTDYVYIPLGGSRQGKGRQVAATLVVFLLSGLWHGANWTFVLWGLWHGLLCAGEILLNRKEGKGWFVTAVLALLSWVMFRAQSVGQAMTLYSALFSPWNVPAGLALLQLDGADAACLAAALMQLPLLHRLSQNEKTNDMVYFVLAVCVLIAWFLRAAGGGAGAFIYFQF